MVKNEGFCRICGIIIENAYRDQKYCSEKKCRQEAQRRRRKKSRQTSEERMQEYRDRMKALECRPWTSGCVDNLYHNMIKGWDIEQTARETNRSPEDVERMMEVIENRGFNDVYEELYHVEKDMQPVIKSEDWLEKNGIVNI